MKSKSFSAFTLIELLIVIGILGVMAVIVLIAINPGQKQAQARDTGRISSVSQLGHAVEAFYTARQGIYPAVGTWAQDLLSGGELASFPSGIAYSVGSAENCTTYQQPASEFTYCYDLDSANGALVFSVAEADSHINKCTSSETAYFVFSSADGRGGTICSNDDPTPWAAGTQSYVD